MLEGWICVHRQIQEHWIWQEKPFNRPQAWMDLLLLANHKEGKILVNGKLIETKIGEVNRSILWLSERWGWSRHKTKNFLDVLENDRMISQKRTSKGSTLTIENYRFFQESSKKGDIRRTSKGQQKDIRRTSKGHQKDIYNNVNNNNNDNNENNGNNNYKGQKSPSVLALIQTLPIELQEPMKDFKEMRQKVKAPLTAKGLSLIIKKLQDLSGGDTETMKKIIDQSIANSWKGVYPLKTQKQKDEFDIMDL